MGLSRRCVELVMVDEDMDGGGVHDCHDVSTYLFGFFFFIPQGFYDCAYWQRPS